MEPTDESPVRRPASNRMKWAKRLFQWIIVLLVMWGIWRTWQRAQRDLEVQQRELQQQLEQLDSEWAERPASERASSALERQYQAQRQQLLSQQFRWSQIRPTWLCVAGLLYFMSTLPCWSFWHLTLHALHQRPKPWTSLRAYSVGQFGKYVPGKALVVILRASWVSGPNVDWFVAAAAVFVESLTMIAVGAAISGILLILLFREDVHPWLLAGAAGLMLVSWLPTVPSIFRLIVSRLQRDTGSHLHRALGGLNRSLILRGWIIMPIAWLLMGLSLWAAAQAVPGTARHVMLPSLHDAALHTACIALAVVLGFASFIPGGFGVRELVVTTLLAPTYGTAQALAVAILLRIVWLVSELVISGILIMGQHVRLSPRLQHVAPPQQGSLSSD